MKKLFVFFAATVLILAFTVPAGAAGEWSFYGSARVLAMSIDRDNGAGVSERNTRFQLLETTRFGAKVSAKNLYGRVEIGFNSNKDTSDSYLSSTANYYSYAAKDMDAYTRLLYGVWDFGGGKLLVGQDGVPDYLGVSSAICPGGTESVMSGRGVFSHSRRPQIRIEVGDFKIAAVGTHKADADGIGAPNANTEITIPKLAAQYKFKIDPATLTFAGAYMGYSIEEAGAPDLDVTAYMVGGRLQVNVGPAKLSGVVAYAQNAGSLGYTVYADSNLPMVINAGTAAARVVDQSTLAYAIVGDYKLNDMIKFQAGYGHTDSEMDDAAATNNGVNDSGAIQENDGAFYYFQAVITLAPGVYIMPEIGVDDRKAGGDGLPDGDYTYFGAKFQIDF